MREDINFKGADIELDLTASNKFEKNFHCHSVSVVHSQVTFKSKHELTEPISLP